MDNEAVTTQLAQFLAKDVGDLHVKWRLAQAQALLLEKEVRRLQEQLDALKPAETDEAVSE